MRSTDSSPFLGFPTGLCATAGVVENVRRAGNIWWRNVEAPILLEPLGMGGEWGRVCWVYGFDAPLAQHVEEGCALALSNSARQGRTMRLEDIAAEGGDIKLL